MGEKTLDRLQRNGSSKNKYYSNQNKRHSDSRLHRGQKISVKDTNQSYKVFLNNTSKAVQIYEFLKKRHSYSPIFLKRNLSYFQRRSKIRRKFPKNGNLVDSLLEKAGKNKIKICLKITVTSLRLPEVSKANMNLSICIIRGKVSNYFDLHKFSRISQKMLKLKFSDGKLSQCTEREAILSFECDLDYLTPSTVVFQLNIENEMDGFYYCILPFFNNSFNNQILAGDYYAVMIPTSGFNLEVNRINSLNGPVDWSQSLVGFSVDKSIENAGESRNNQKRISSSRSFRDSNLIFEFVFNEKHRKHFSSNSGYICPFCCVDCLVLSALMIHLKHSHPRFTFNCVGAENLIIQIGINEFFDGSYEGNPIRSHILEVEGSLPPGPLCRTPRTTMLVINKSKKRERVGLARHVLPLQLVYNPMSSQPLTKNELTLPKNGAEFSWLNHMMTDLMDDFSDVNGGEKEIMKMWNSFLSTNTRCLGDAHLVSTCRKFVDVHKKTILDNMLCHNFLLHLITLHNFRLIGEGDILSIWESLMYYINSD